MEITLNAYEASFDCCPLYLPACSLSVTNDEGKQLEASWGGGGGGGGRQIRRKMKHFKKGKINSFLNRKHFKQTLGVELG